ncbi:MAG: ERF family protein [Pseudomonadota bacterium]
MDDTLDLQIEERLEMAEPATQAVARHAPAPAAPMAAEPRESGAMLAMIERVAMTPGANVEAMDRLLAMHERMEAKGAQQAFTAALPAMLADLPQIEKMGKADRYKFAKWEHVQASITPVLSAHGFSFNAYPETAQENGVIWVTVRATLSHASGHAEHASIRLRCEGPKGTNEAQAFGSTTSYARRYLAGMMLNLAFSDVNADDDGRGGARNKGDAPKGPINEQQFRDLRDLLEAAQMDEDTFLNGKAPTLPELPAADYAEAKAFLQGRIAQMKKRAAREATS